MFKLKKFDVRKKALELALEGIIEFEKTYKVSKLASNKNIQIILSNILPYTSRYWIKSFEKSIEAYFCSKLLENTSDKIEILDVGCGSGQMICAIVNSSNVNCVVDGLDNFQERDTHKITFENHNFTRKLYEVDFNKIQNFTKNKYDYIFGLNSIRMSTNIEQTLRFLSNYLKPNGKIVFNTITEEFQNKFFESSYEIAKGETFT